MSENAEQLIDEYFAQLKAEGRSSPAGKYWHSFFKRITRDFEQTDLPGNPLILGGSGASDQVKQERPARAVSLGASKRTVDGGFGLTQFHSLRSLEYWNARQLAQGLLSFR